jgi:hypothetical protein
MLLFDFNHLSEPISDDRFLIHFEVTCRCIRPFPSRVENFDKKAASPALAGKAARVA